MITESDFLGTWHISRKIEDKLGQSSGTFDGTACFERGDGLVRYAEDGTLTTVSGASMRAERVYLWRFGAGHVEVSFDDGRAFHGFDLRPECRAYHLCGADDYHVLYDFQSWPEWRADWTVSGPRKSYVMRSRYTRCAGA